MKMPESKEDLVSEITIPLALCFGTTLGIVFEQIGIVYGAAGGLMVGIIIPLLYGPSSFKEKENTDKSNT